MSESTLLTVFIPTFFFVSITPGMCMTLAMTLGMSIGVRRTLWMMVGELLGVAMVAIAAVLGVASVMMNYPQIFALLTWFGGAYLVYVGITMWQANDSLSTGKNDKVDSRRRVLFSQGLITAVANPKGWAFMISLLPPFITVERALAPQIATLLAVIMVTEFTSMLAYASGGASLRVFLNRGNNIKWMNAIAGSMMIGVGLWLAFGHTDLNTA
jgi:threonine/homoserine/homoserine lactone efflux protein